MTAYRPDIDGLRAVAVVAVVLYHAHLGPFTGGFVGVDVFFVISGYLIVGLILDDIEHARFSIAAFYERRMRRLFPALFALLAACSSAGYFLFLPLEFEKFGRSVVATTVYVSNFLFWSEAGYFDSPPELKPLLHTWSLAVEEQFYLIFPALLIAITKYRKHWLNGAMLAVAIVSFAISAASLVKHPDAAFYLPHTRMWELTIGALLVSARLPQPVTQNARTVLAALGLALIVASAVWYSSRTPFPGPAALLPCLGAALVVHTGRVGSPIHALLSSRAVVYVGLVSYSLYLWHWPLLVFARAFTVRPLTGLEAGLLVVASFAVAHLSWRYVEAPFRTRPPRFTRRQIFSAAAAATLAMLAVGGVVAANDGLPRRVPAEVATAASGGADLDLDFRRRCSNFAPEQVSVDVLCRLGSAKEAVPTFILWGDSHAYALARMVAAVADDDGRVGLFAGSGGCAPLLGVSRTARRAFPCEAFNDRVVELIRADAELGTVVIASRWTLAADGRRYLYEAGPETFVRDAQSHEESRIENRAVFARGFVRTIEALQRAGKRIVVIGPIPEVGFDVPTTMARNLWFDRDVAIEPTVAAFLDRQQFVLDTLTAAQARYGFELVQPYRSLCDSQRCRVGTRDRPYYADDNHLSLTGALTLKPLLEGKL